MTDLIKELTGGMQRLCAVANRVVSGNASRIDTDLLLEDLRHLYDVALQLSGDPIPETVSTPEVTSETQEQDDARPEEKMMAMMATMAALAPAPEQEPVVTVQHESTHEPEPSTETNEVASPKPEPATEPQEEPVAEPEPVAESQEEPIIEPEPVTMESVELDDNALLFDEIILEPESTQPEPAPEPEPEPEPLQEPEAKPVPEPEPKQEPEPTKQPSLLDYLKQPADPQPTQRTIGETLAAAGIRYGNPLQQSLEKKVDDLRTVININDKFSFMSELFKNNMKAYNDFIMRLNGLTNRDEAMAEVKSAAQQYGWNNDSLAVKNFYKVFDKKF